MDASRHSLVLGAVAGFLIALLHVCLAALSQ
jgi:hypothetical protein